MKISNDNLSKLFSSYAAADTTGTTQLLTNYASIKNGSYNKLLKAYYNEAKKTDVKSTGEKTTEDKTKVSNNATESILADAEASELSAVKSSSDDLKAAADSIDKLLTSGADTDALASAIKDFADKYNEVVKNTSKVDHPAVAKQAASLKDATKINSNLLSSIGVDINKDNTLSVDTDKVKKASDSTLKTLFSNKGSYADNVSAKASMLSNSASGALTAHSSYSAKAVKNSNPSYVGSLFDSFL